MPILILSCGKHHWTCASLNPNISIDSSLESFQTAKWCNLYTCSGHCFSFDKHFLHWLHNSPL